MWNVEAGRPYWLHIKVLSSLEAGGQRKLKTRLREVLLVNVAEFHRRKTPNQGSSAIPRKGYWWGKDGLLYVEWGHLSSCLHISWIPQRFMHPLIWQKKKKKQTTCYSLLQGCFLIRSWLQMLMRVFCLTREQVHTMRSVCLHPFFWHLGS